MKIKKDKLPYLILLIPFLIGGIAGVTDYFNSTRIEEEKELTLLAENAFGDIPVNFPEYAVKESLDSTFFVSDNVPAEDFARLVNVYKYNKDLKLTLEDASNIAGIFDLTTTGETQPDGSVIFIGPGNTALTFWETSQQLSYYSSNIDYSAQKPALENIQNLAISLLERFNLKNYDFSPYSQGASYLIKEGAEYPKEGSPNNYDSINLPFVRNVPIFKTTSLPYNKYLLSFTYGPGNTLLSLNLFYVPLANSSVSTYVLKSFEQAKSEVSLGNGKIVSVDLPLDYYRRVNFSIPEIKSFSATSFGVFYLDRQNLDFLQPVFVFEGLASFLDGNSYKATLYTEAVLPK